MSTARQEQRIHPARVAGPTIVERIRTAVAAAGVIPLALLSGCGTPVVKPAAFDQQVLQRRPLPAAQLRQDPYGERRLAPGIEWFGDVNPLDRLTFAAHRRAGNSVCFCAVVECDPASDRLVLLPLADGATPLEVLADPEQAHELSLRIAASRDSEITSDAIVTSLTEVIREKRLASPLPVPQRIYAVAANFPSHLQHDLAVFLSRKQLAALRRSRARVFLKHPPITVEGKMLADPPSPLGPYDDFLYPARIRLPAYAMSDTVDTPTMLDYEVELGVVLSRSLTWVDIREAPDQTIRSAVAGYVLVSDTKGRNPQVVDKVADQDLPLPDESDPYRIGEERLDRAFGFWDRPTCRWWSFAASRVTCTSLGPFFVAAASHRPLAPRALISARSYAPENRRGAPLPPGRMSHALYLRQCSSAAEVPVYDDALIWSIPDIVRSILDPDRNALHFGDRSPALNRGDIICLGTPGGAVITSKRQSTVGFLDLLLFWWRPRDFHDAFFEPNAALYLREGDQLFLWGEGLGCQLHRVTLQNK